MSDNSKIEWCDATWNCIRGCTKVSAGCAHCYAETFAERFRGVPGHPYEQGFDLRLVPEKLAEPLSWKKPRRVFVNSMSDLFQDGVPDDYIDQVFAVMALAPMHTFQVLTKRPVRMRAYVLGIAYDEARSQRFYDACDDLHVGGADAAMDADWPLPNVWLGVSVENQHFADERIPLLLQTPAAVRFISAEPVLGPVSFESWMFRDVPSEAPNIHRVARTRDLDWVIVGGESGSGARPFDVAWARSIVQQCKAAGVACFVKQFGANVRDRNDAGFEGDTPRSWPMDTDVRDYPDGYREDYQGAPVRVMLSKKGGDLSEWPEDLRVREFPR
jgi:protein gp37